VKPRIVDRSIAYSGYLTVEKLSIKLADGTTVSRDIEAHGDAAAVLPYDMGRRCALVVRLFRAPIFSITHEIAVEEACAGMIEGEEDEAAARREAYEHSGCRCKSWSAWRAFGRVPAYQRKDSPCSSPPTLPRIGSARAVEWQANMKELLWLNERWSTWLTISVRGELSTASW